MITHNAINVSRKSTSFWSVQHPNGGQNLQQVQYNLFFFKNNYFGKFWFPSQKDLGEIMFIRPNLEKVTFKDLFLRF